MTQGKARGGAVTVAHKLQPEGSERDTFMIMPKLQACDWLKGYFYDYAGNQPISLAKTRVRVLYNVVIARTCLSTGL